MSTVLHIFSKITFEEFKTYTGFLESILPYGKMFSFHLKYAIVICVPNKYFKVYKNPNIQKLEFLLSFKVNILLSRKWLDKITLPFCYSENRR